MAIKKQIISTKEQTSLFLAIIIGALLGVLGNMLVTAIFRFEDVYEKPIEPHIELAIAILLFGGILLFLFIIFKSSLNKLGEKKK